MDSTSLMRPAARADTRYLATFVLSIAAAGLVLGAVRYDRRPPLIYIDSKVLPDPARSGGDITVQRYVEWKRACAGEASTELISPKGYVYARERAVRLPPQQLGYHSSPVTWTLPNDLLPDGDSLGTAIYRGAVHFHDCGVTSWLIPLTVPYLERSFEVRR